MGRLARGYIASGEFNSYRTPQHLQNQIIKLYCAANGLVFVLSRAEYWINENTKCQLWAALNEGFEHIVFFSLWQLPNDEDERHKIYLHCKENRIILHFATEQMRTEKNQNSFEDIETLFKTNLMILGDQNYSNDLKLIKRLI